MRSIDLGYSGLAILDRDDQLVLSGFAHPRSLVALRRFGKASSGVLSDAPGLDGSPGHVVAFARSKVPRWSVILDRPRSAIFGDARRNLVIELGLIAGAALFGLALLAWILARARAETSPGEQARRRRLRYEQEHTVAITLQRSLLSAIPPIASIDSAAATRPAAPASRSEATGTTSSSGPTGSCTSRSATSPGAASRRLR